VCVCVRASHGSQVCVCVFARNMWCSQCVGPLRSGRGWVVFARHVGQSVWGRSTLGGGGCHVHFRCYLATVVPCMAGASCTGHPKHTRLSVNDTRDFYPRTHFCRHHPAPPPVDTLRFPCAGPCVPPSGAPPLVPSGASVHRVDLHPPVASSG
jgi:hypothetical protein